MTTKNFFIFVLILAALAGGFEYYQRYQQNIRDLAQKGADKLGEELASLNEKKEVSAPGGLRFGSDSKSAFLTRVGVINFTNQERQKNGLPLLSENQKLNQAAMTKVKDMFAGQYFEHISPLGKGPADLAEAAGYRYIAVGENLALGNFKNDSELVLAWMNSPGHRANILNGKYTEIGVAVMEGTFEGRKTWLAVQEFGRPESSCPSVDKNLKSQLDFYKSEIAVLKSQIDSLKAYLDSANPKTKKEVDEYNQKVAEFNDLVKVYNNKVDWLKLMTAQYNSQVSAYNACVGS